MWQKANKIYFAHQHFRVTSCSNINCCLLSFARDSHWHGNNHQSNRQKASLVVKYVLERFRTRVPNLWHAYHRWYAEAFQVVRKIFSNHAKRICFHGILTKIFLLYNWNKLQENRLASEMCIIMFDVAYSYKGIANSLLACGPVFVLQQQAATPSNIVAGVMEMVRWIYGSRFCAYFVFIEIVKLRDQNYSFSSFTVLANIFS